MKRLVILSLLILIYLNEAHGQRLASRLPQASKPLLECFSGIQCRFCDPGDIVEEGIQKSSCDVSIVNFHAGIFSAPNVGQIDLRTLTGELYNKYYNIESYPTGRVNRNSSFKSSTFWQNDYSNNRITPTPVNIGIKSDLSASNRKLKLEIELFYTDNGNDSVNFLNVFLVENKIKGFQLMLNQVGNNNYLHNHVFRNTLTSDWGVAVHNIQKGNSNRFNFETTIPSNYNNDNLEIIAFVTNQSNEVYTSAKIKANNDSNAPIAIMDDRSIPLFTIDNNFSSSFKFTLQSNFNYTNNFFIELISTLTKDMKFEVYTDGRKINNKDSIQFTPFEIKEIIVKITQGETPGYGKFTIRIDPNPQKGEKEGECGESEFSKIFNCQLGCGNFVIITNPNPLTDGRPNTIDLEKPIILALEKIKCKNFCHLASEEMIHFDKYLDTTCPSKIYYAAGWGKPAISDSLVDVFSTLIQSNKISLFITGQDLSFQMAGLKEPGSDATKKTYDFMIDYLQTFYFNNGDSTRNKVSAIKTDTFFGNIGTATIEPVYKTNTLLNLYPDHAYPNSNIPQFFLRYNDNKTAAFYGQINKYKFVYMPVGLEMFMKDTIFLTKLVNGVLKYFGDSCYVNTTSTIHHINQKININSLVNDIIQITNLNSIQDEKTIEIFDLSGKILIKRNVQASIDELEVNVKDFASGLYIINIKVRNELNFTKKIVVY
ncbi:MAG: Omp28-related outer membrane protein [Saprospiraceae bacterium]